MDQREFNSCSTHHVTTPLCPADHLDICAYSYHDSSRSRDALLFQSIPSSLVGGIESYLDPKYIADPSTFTSRLPFLPLPGNYAMYDWGFEPAFIRKRNERERQRVKCVNEGYARLREHLPQEYAEKRLSKVEMYSTVFIRKSNITHHRQLILSRFVSQALVRDIQHLVIQNFFVLLSC